MSTGSVLPSLAHLGQHARAVQHRHRDVEDRPDRTPALPAGRPFSPSSASSTLQVQLGENLGHDHADGAAIIDGQDTWHWISSPIRQPIVDSPAPPNRHPLSAAVIGARPQRTERSPGSPSATLMAIARSTCPATMFSSSLSESSTIPGSSSLGAICRRKPGRTGGLIRADRHRHGLTTLDGTRRAEMSFEEMASLLAGFKLSPQLACMTFDTKERRAAGWERGSHLSRVGFWTVASDFRHGPLSRFCRSAAPRLKRCLPASTAG